MTDKQIANELTDVYNRVFDKLAISSEYRPAFVVSSMLHEAQGGGYYPEIHTILIGANNFRSALMEPIKLMAHEATHCDEALKRASLSDERRNEVIKNELISKITNGEDGKVIVGISAFGSILLNPPKFPNKMKNDFIEFAKENLYDNSKNLPPELNMYIIIHELENYSNPKIRPNMLEIMNKKIEIGCSPEEKNFIDNFKNLTPDECKFEARAGKKTVFRK